VENADVIVTCTPSRKPLLKREWVKPGAHINAIGADAKGKEELHPKLLSVCKVVVDDWEQASHSGEINVPISKKLFSKKRLHAELADIVSGRKRGRVRRDEITVFDSTGLAVLDIFFAKYAYNLCCPRG
jgi:alanine dehydrogenase